MGERGRKEFIKTDPKFFSLDGGLLKYFSIQSVSFQKSYVQIVTQYACVTIKRMFSSAIFRSPIKAIHSAGWKSLPYSTYCSALLVVVFLPVYSCGIFPF